MYCVILLNFTVENKISLLPSIQRDKSSHVTNSIFPSTTITWEIVSWSLSAAWLFFLLVYCTILFYVINVNWGPGGRDDKGKSALPPTHCAKLGVVGWIPTHGQLALPWVYLGDLSCAVKNSCGYSVWCCNIRVDL